jgi:hypothetical protein
LLPIVPSGKTSHLRHDFLKNERYASTGRKERIELELKFEAAWVHQPRKEVLCFQKPFDRMSERRESMSHVISQSGVQNGWIRESGEIVADWTQALVAAEALQARRPATAALSRFGTVRCSDFRQIQLSFD